MTERFTPDPVIFNKIREDVVTALRIAAITPGIRCKIGQEVSDDGTFFKIEKMGNTTLLNIKKTVCKQIPKLLIEEKESGGFVKVYFKNYHDQLLEQMTDKV